MEGRPSTELVLASDSEREQAIVRLRDAVVAGRLTLEEFGERVDGAHAARTTAELATLTRDIPEHASSAEAPLSHRAVCSHLVRRGPLVLGLRTRFSSIFGTIDLDLREATITGPEAHLDVFNVFGTVTVTVPHGACVVVEGGGPLASEDLDLADLRPVEGAPTIRIHASGPGGALRVRCL